MDYLAEHTQTGAFGDYMLIGALIFSLMAALLYFSAGNSKSRIRLAGGAFIMQLGALIAASTTLYLMIFNHYFEYHYVWQYTSRDTSGLYLVSAFWAGKEGSLLLWIVLQALIGTILLFKRSTPARVMGIIASLQFVMILFVAGIPLFGLHLGNSPFVLLREMAENRGIPMFANPSYLLMLTDGNGLNPLLKNPWMAIHPPVLFLGYAACMVPYAFGINSMFRVQTNRRYSLFWPVFAVFCLGAGLILGGAWAYEDLSFGGFWSWDPVENASLVPWIAMLACLHLLQVQAFRKSGIKLAIIPYLSVLFAAYLTRSGVLSTTSVHSFSSGTANYQFLVLTLTAALLPVLISVLRKNTKRSVVTTRLNAVSIFVLCGVTILFLAAFQVFFVTSLPAFNQWLGLKLAAPVQSTAFYNGWQSWFAAGFLMCIALTVYFRSGLTKAVKNMAPALLFAITGCILLVIFGKPLPLPVWIMTFALLFGSFALLDSLLRSTIKHGNLAATLTHLGFVLFLLGAVFSFGWQGSLFPSGPDNPKSLQTLVKGQIKPTSEGYVSYAGREITGDVIRYRIDFLKKQNENLYLDYSLFPSITEAENMGPVPKPDTRKTIFRDVFVHLTNTGITKEEYSPMLTKALGCNDTLLSGAGFLILDSISENPGSDPERGKLNATAHCRYIAAGRPAVSMNPSMQVNGDQEQYSDAIRDSLNLRLRLLYPVSKDTAMLELAARKTDFVVLSAKTFPLINLMWLGIVIMTVGLSISLIRRSFNR
jgi:cytochrome c-type biogenesis protein CcmF